MPETPGPHTQQQAQSAILNAQFAIQQPQPALARLRNLRDVSGAYWRRRDALQRRLAARLAQHGYRRLDTPLLEPTELFLRKSGGELASQLYSFTDPGGRAVSLRPEFTSAVMRHHLERAAAELPARWQYCGPVFRYAGPGDGAASTAGQFTQLGGELIGASGLLADAEVLELAVAALDEAGLSGWTLQLADLDVLDGLLAPLGLTERARAFVVQSVPRLRQGPAAVSRLLAEGHHLHLLGQGGEADYYSEMVAGLDDEQARVVLLGLLRANGNAQFGQRTPEDVVDRMLRKGRRPDDAGQLRTALETASRLAQIRGAPETALPAAAAVLRAAGGDEAAVNPLRQTLELLAAGGGVSGGIVVDFGMARGLAYYNGLIFEVTHPQCPVPLGGGGRYDRLVRDLGAGERLPALGFAYNLDALLELTESGDPESGDDSGGGTLVVPDGAAGASLSAAIAAAQELRRRGESAELEVTGRTPAAARQFAAGRGLARIIAVGADGQQTAYRL